MDVGGSGSVVCRRLVASTIRLGPFAFSALATALAVFLALGWRADQQVVALHVDMLRRERALSAVVLAGTERAVAEPGAGSEQTLAHLDLLVISWATLSDGGPELGLDLQLTGRIVRSLPGLDTRFAEVSDRLTVYRDNVIETLAEGAETDGLPALREESADLVDRFVLVLRDVIEDRPSDPRLWWAAASLALAIGCLGVSVIPVRIRRRTVRRELSPPVPTIVGERRRRQHRCSRTPRRVATRQLDRRGCPRRSRRVRPDSTAS